VRDPAAWIERLTAREGGNGGSADVPDLLSLATDGETFGTTTGRRRDAGAVLDALGKRSDVRVDNFAAFLARHPPQEDVKLVAPSAWSCPHGVERWRSDCGCRVHGDRATHQRWRAPLRNALDWLAAELHGVFEREGGAIFAADPWTVRTSTAPRWERRTTPSRASSASGCAVPTIGGAGPGRELLELERHALRMFTSCGWFFDDIAGLESLIVLRSAARAIELAARTPPASKRVCWSDSPWRQATIRRSPRGGPVSERREGCAAPRRAT